MEVSSAEMERNFAVYRQRAETEAVMVVHDNRRSVVMMPAAAYARLMHEDKPELGKDFKAFLLGGPKVDEFPVERDGDTGRHIEF